MHKVLNLLKRKDISGVDFENGTIYTSDQHASTKTVAMASRLGYRIVATGKIVPMEARILEEGLEVYEVCLLRLRGEGWRIWPAASSSPGDGDLRGLPKPWHHFAGICGDAF